ncbi:hypothetical protein DRH14_02910 [Candidatus Shapirobacteria bacterium]|nr:MAG: hypothetical protein DRH14_02910 [Candidatus Shapirobacteria bacterium]
MKQKLSLTFLYYLRFLAQLQLTKIKFLSQLKYKQPLTIVGITGSAGKTSTLLAIISAIQPHFKIKHNLGANSESGIPLNILDIKIKQYTLFNWLKITFLAPLKLLISWPSYQIYLVEMGIDAPFLPKNMDYLLTIVKPQIAVFLNVSPVHLFNFDNIDQIAQQKAKIFNYAKYAIINPQDKLVKKSSQKLTIPVIPIQPTPIKLKLQLTPSIYQISFGASIAIAKLLGINKTIAIKNIQKNFQLPPSRASVFKGIKNSTIIDSSYNSSPLACQELLKFLSKFKPPRLAVLGDMRELGQQTASAHRQLYKLALQQADQIISVGPLTQKYFGSQAKKFTYWWQASNYILKNLAHHSTILIKGSQNTIFLEEIVKQLLANKKNIKSICRQSNYWLQLKSKFKQTNS